jgi:G3E family GTPase
VIVNEFGEIGLDHLLIARGSDNVVLLDAGCLCCTIAESLHETLADLNFRKVRGEIPPFERVIIETTGLAVPGPILNTLLGHRLVTDHYRLEAVVVAVDAQHALANLDVASEVALQIAVADRLVITKRDLVPMQDALVARLDAINPHAARFDAHDAGALTALFGPGERYRLPHRFVPAGVRAANRRGLHVDAANRIRADAFVLPHPPTWSGIAAWWGVASTEFGDRLLRCKGLLEIAETGEIVFVQGVQRIFHAPERLSGWPDADHRSRPRLHHARRRRGRIAPHAARIRCCCGHATRTEAVRLSVGEPAMSCDFVLRGGIVVRPEHSPAPMDILVRDGTHRRAARARGTCRRRECQCKPRRACTYFPA